MRRSAQLVSCSLGALIVSLSIAVPGSSVLAQPSMIPQFDYFTTGFRLDGAHQFAPCETCHTDAIFVGTPIDCAGCHTRASRVPASPRPAHHIFASERCESCHHTGAWVPTLRVDHLEVFGACMTCHDNRTAMGKPVGHLPTSDTCDDCHRTTSFAPAVFDHVGIMGGCFGCHDGLTALGKPPNHIPATNQCEDCHSVLSFSPVGRVDHNQVLGTCSSCHNGVIAMGQHAEHIPTTAECDSCHTTTVWAP